MNELLERIQHRIAITCLGPSSLRNQGSPNVLHSARQHLMHLRIDSFSTTSGKKFRNALNNETSKMLRRLPQGAQNWGAARKALNLFLRDALYNTYLAKYYSLTTVEPYLEIPLDGIVARALLSLYKTELPLWRSIKSLTIEESDLYQAKALEHAQKLGMNRVHLDLILWTQGGRSVVFAREA
jgi:hypothetical protein